MARVTAVAVLGVALGFGGVGESVAQSGMKKDDTMKMDDKMKSGDSMKSGDTMKKAGDGMKKDDMKKDDMKKDDMKKDGKAPMQGDRTMEKKQ
jgi:pentapeptide MXKDX repeat protein